MLRPQLPSTAYSRGVFTRDEALSCGWTARSIRTQLATQRWLQLAQGRYVESQIFLALDARERHRLSALARAFSRPVVVRGSSAACLHGMDVLVLPTRVKCRHASEFDGHDVTELSGALVTTPALTVVDCARSLGPEAGLVTADSALRIRKVSKPDLVEQLRRVEGDKGTQSAAFVVSEADGQAESPLESVSRYRFIVGGLPRPELQVRIGNRRADFLWAKYRVIGEADGLKKYGDNELEVQAKIRAERQRQQELEDAGYVIVRWLWREIWFTPDLVIGRVWRELRRAGYPAA